MAMTEEEKRAWREQHEKAQQESAARKKAEREQKRVKRAAERDRKMQAASAAVAVQEVAPPAPLEVAMVQDNAAAAGAIEEVRNDVAECEKLRVQRKTARFFEDVMNDPAEQTRDRLNAAQGLARLYGLGREEVSVTVSPSEAWLQAHLAAAAAEQKPWLRGGKQ